MSKFLKTAKILLVGYKPSNRSGLRKMLCDMGGDNRLIEVTADLEQTKERFSADPVNIVFIDDDFENQEVMYEVMKLHQVNNPISTQRLFILTAGVVSGPFRNEFSSKGGDLIIDKPFTIGSFSGAFNILLDGKVSLSPDEKSILNVEDALKKNDRLKAVEFLKAIKNQKSHPALYSQGIISQYDQDFFNAYNHFILSLEKKVDLKSLVNVVSTGIKSKKYSELAPFVETWIKQFPLQSESIPDITRVVLYNKKFDLLKEMKSDDQVARVPMAAGMVVASSFYLDLGESKLCIEFAKKAIEYSGPKKHILMKGFEILVQAGAMVEALRIFENPKLQATFAEDQVLLKSLKKILQISL